MNKRAFLKKVDEIVNRLEARIYRESPNRGQEHWMRLISAAQKRERDHRKHVDGPYYVSVPAAARFFVVYRLALIISKRTPLFEFKDILDLPECSVIAQAILDKYPALSEVMTEEERDEMIVADYNKLVRE